MDVQSQYRLGSLLDSDNVERLMCWKAGQRFQASAAAFARAVPLVTLNSRRMHYGTLTDAEMKELYDEITNSLKSADLQRSGNIIWRFSCAMLLGPRARQFAMSMFGERGGSLKAGLNRNIFVSGLSDLVPTLSSGRGTMH